MRRHTPKDVSMRKRASENENILYAQKLSKMIDCKTVWTGDGIYRNEFSKFYSLIDELFPSVTARAEKLVFGGGCFVYVIRGKNAKRNIMLMSHHDVVDAEDGWKTEPFKACIKDGFLYGRGTIDTKTSLFAILRSAEELIDEGYDFDGIDLYIGSSHNEEAGGDGMLLAAEYFEKNNLRFDLLLDEGGAITEGQIPGVKCKSAVVAVHEKSRHLYRCSTELIGKGHGGLAGSKDSATERLSCFVAEVCRKKNKIFKAKFYPEVKQTFKSHTPYMSFPMNFLFGNINLFSPVIKGIMMKIPAASAMLSTSVAFNTLNAGDMENVKLRAKRAEATMFLRCVREKDLYNGLEKIKKIAKKYGISIEAISEDYCSPTDYNKEAFKRLEAILNENFPDVAVAPFLLTAGTDARHFGKVADNILRFAPIDLDREQFASIHSSNERIRIENIGECVIFYKDVIKKIYKEDYHE